jgi:sugar lactone lactonase YvrE
LIADIGLNRVLAFTPDGQLDTTWGDGGMSQRLVFPSALALGPDDALYVLQLGNSEIHVLDGDGLEQDFWVVGGNQELSGLGVPVAVAVDAQGVAYVPDHSSQQIRRYAPNGDDLEAWPFPLGELAADQIWPRDIIALDDRIVLSYSDPAGAAGGLLSFDADGRAALLPDQARAGEARAPGGLAADPAGAVTALYLSDDVDATPFIASDEGGWEPEGIETLTPVNGLFVTGLAYDTRGRLLVADPSSQRVRMYTADGAVAGDIQAPRDQGLLAGIDEILVGADGLLYVADPLLGRVVAYRPDGGVQTIFQMPDNPDAPLTTGFTRQRMRIAVDAFGSVYVVDEFTGRITKFRQDGEVDTTDWALSADLERPVVALMLAAGADERIYLVDIEFQDRIRVFNQFGEDLGVLVEPFWEGAIQDLVVSGDTLYTVELGLGSSPLRRFSASGDEQDEIVDLSRGDGNGNRTGFALAVEPDGALLIGAVDVSSGPDFEYQLLRLTRDGDLRRIGTLPTPFTTQPDITISPDGQLYIASANDQLIYVYEPDE